MTIRLKLIGLCALLVCVPLALLGVSGLLGLHSSARDQTRIAHAEVQTLATQLLETGARADHDTLAAIFDRAALDANSLAQSPLVAEALTLADGSNATWNKVNSDGAIRTLAAIQEACAFQEAVAERQASNNLNVFRSTLERAGGLGITAQKVAWSLIDPVTGAVSKTELPQVVLDGNFILPNADADVEAPLVDTLARQTGGLATVFQRLNEAGDMMRIITSIRDATGKRAIGTVIRAIGTDGKPNPVLAAVLAGKTYNGRAKVLGAWCATAYHPTQDEDGKVTGMLFYGFAETADPQIAKGILDRRIGNDGYNLTLDAEGRIAIHADKALIGKPASQLPFPATAIVAHRTAGQPGRLDCTIGGRRAMVVYAWLPNWEWTLVAVAFVDDLTRNQLAGARQRVNDAILSTYHLAAIDGAGKSMPLHRQIRIIAPDGKELWHLLAGEPVAELKDLSDRSWFKAAATLAPGKIRLWPVEVSPDTGKPELHCLAPIHIDGKLHGVVATSLDWQIVTALFSTRRYCQTGYPIVIDHAGQLTVHPTEPFGSASLLTAGSELTKVVTERWMSDKEGTTAYTFKGVDKVCAWDPLTIGDFRCTVIATVPSAEAFAGAEKVAEHGRNATRTMSWMVLMAVSVLTLVGLGIGLLISRALTRPLLGTVAVLQAMAAGDTSRRLDAKGRDELAELARAVNTTVDHMQGIVDTVRTEAESLVAAAAELDRAGGAVAEVATTTAGRAADADRGIQGMTGNVSSVATAAEQMTSSINEISRNATEAAKVAADALREVKAAAEGMAKLDGASRAIGDVTKVISSIAEQTNLLALNATIEAARAGDAGRGFAVVAGEVKALAQQTGDATGDVAGRIKGIQGHADEAIAAIQRIAATIEKINQLQQSISAAVEQQSATTAEISRSVGEAAASGSEVARSTAEMATAAQSGTGTAEAVRTAGTHVAELARKLLAATKKTG